MKLPNSWTKVTTFSKIMAMALFVSLPFIGFYFGINYQKLQQSIETLVTDPEKDTPTPMVTSPSDKSDQPIVIYSQQISQQNTANRSWPTVKIFRKIGNNTPEVLIPSMGTVDEYPSDYVLSPDKKTLLINLENKFVLFDLQTKQIYKTITLEHGGNYRGVNFSPDSNKLFIWDHQYAGADRSYSVYIYDLKTGQKTPLSVDQSLTQSLSVEKWRNDNIIILRQPMGDYSNLWTYNLNSNKLENKNQIYGRISENGQIMVVEDFNASKEDPCNEMMGTDIGGYKFIDPSSLKQVDSLYGDDKVVHYVASSLNNQSFMFYTMNPIKTPDTGFELPLCDQLNQQKFDSRQYILKTIGSSSIPVEDPLVVINSWKPTLTGWEIPYDLRTEYRNMLNLPDNAKIIYQYYQ